MHVGKNSSSLISCSENGEQGQVAKCPGHQQVLTTQLYLKWHEQKQGYSLLTSD